jgi:hypothetical protein
MIKSGKLETPLCYGESDQLFPDLESLEDKLQVFAHLIVERIVEDQKQQVIRQINGADEAYGLK